MLTITGYQIQEQLSESVHSLIYRAQREADGQPVILKALRHEYPTPAQLARYKREYEITRSLHSVEGVINVYDLLKHGNSLVMVFEDIGGQSLNHLIGDQFPSPGGIKGEGQKLPLVGGAGGGGPSRSSCALPSVSQRSWARFTPPM